MDVHINLFAVLLGGVASMIIGMVYYADGVFGKEWKDLAKIDGKRFQKEMPRVMPWVFVAALVTAFVTAYVAFLYHNFFIDSSWIVAGLMSSLLIWFGGAATALFVHNSLEQRPYKLTVIALGNRLLSLLAIGAIIGWLHP